MQLSVGPEQVCHRLERLGGIDRGGAARRGRVKLMLDVLTAISEGRVADPASTAAAVVAGVDRRTLLNRRATERGDRGARRVAPEPARLQARAESAGATKAGLDRVMQRHIRKTVKVLPGHRLIYVSTPKVASSTMKATLWRLGLGDPEAVPPKQVHDTRNSPLQSPPEVGFDEFVQWVNQPDYRRVCFVRNPYSRLLSCYLNKIKGTDSDNRFGIYSYRAKVSKDGTTGPVTFDDFVDTVSRQAPMKMDPHWRIQTAHLLWDQISYDFIGRIEEFTSDLDRLGAVLGVDLKTYLDVRNRHRTEAKTALSNYYTPDLQERVYRIYEADFKAFGYSAELPAAAISS